MRRLVAISLLVCFVLGCVEVNRDDAGPAVEEKDTFESSSADAIQVGLASLAGERPVLSYEALLDDGHITDLGQSSGTAVMTGNMRKALLILGRYRTDRLDDDMFRVQRFSLNNSFHAARLPVMWSIPSTFPPRADADVEFARWFGDRSTLIGAPCFSLLDIPYDADTALNLPEGTVAPCRFPQM